MDGPERLDGRDGQVWAAYISGATQEAIARQHGVTQQRVSQILSEIRASIGDVARTDAALLAQERTDALLAAVWPAAMSGDPKAVGAALRVLERQAKALGTDAVEPIAVTFERHLDDQGQLVAAALRAAFDALELSPEQQAWAAYAASTALYQSAGQDPPADAPPPPPHPSSPAAPVEVPVDPRAGMEQRLRDLVADEDVDVDALLAEVDKEEGRGDG
ncbi:hypothetical protein [Streptomyces caniscabiei]|uniref:hypothetical protein n=1 Tax=Streptomyces caniscabiei TaxID=2746961 RepID=UPI001872B67C|nr:hypothetical protein [Streptomyces caniscabiei]MBE4791727.1 hypothetical protein [Streptomyces caniscabiei]